MTRRIFASFLTGALAGGLLVAWLRPPRVEIREVRVALPVPCPARPEAPTPEIPQEVPALAPQPAPAPSKPPEALPPLPTLVPSPKEGLGRPTTVDLAASIDRHPIWTEDWPEELGPSGFPDRARRAFQECEGPFTWLGADCSEPPCYAAFVAPRGVSEGALLQWLLSCATWSEAYGTTVDRWTRCSRGLACPDGSEYSFFLLTSDRAWAPLAAQGFDDPIPLKALQQQRCDDQTVLFSCP